MYNRVACIMIFDNASEGVVVDEAKEEETSEISHDLVSCCESAG